MNVFFVIILIICAYLLGNISPATILARASGHDIKSEGSGNAGTTNVLRVVGKKAAIITLLIDVGKGILATKLGYIISLSFFQKTNAPGLDSASIALVISGFLGLAVFIGHIWPVVHHFQGGKGVATALGVLIATDWKLALICLLIFVIVVAITKMVSLGSLIAALSFLIIFLAKNLYLNTISQADKAMPFGGVLLILPFVIMVALLFFKHSQNIKRILNGTENKLDLKKSK